jgi:hypothetical protein
MCTVSVSPSSFRTKISVGSNPWQPAEPTHNLASICERYGGGGHARVGVISLPSGELERARAITAEIVAELRPQSGREAAAKPASFGRFTQEAWSKPFFSEAVWVNHPKWPEAVLTWRLS